MGTARRIYKNAMYLGTAEFVSKILQFVVMLYAARLLSQDNFGQFNFALSLSLIAVVLADFGINALLVREISRDKKSAGKYFFNAFLIKAVLSLATCFLIVAAVNVLEYPADAKHIVYIIWAFAILSTFTELFYSIFRAFEMMFYDALLKILRMALLTFSSLYVLFKGLGVAVFSYTFVFVEAIVVLLALFIAMKKFIRIEVVIDYSLVRFIIKRAFPFMLSAVFGAIYFFIGAVMLSKIKGDVEVAVFSAAYNIVLAILFIPTIYTNAIYPVLSRYYKEGRNELKTLYERSFKYLYIAGFPISIGLYLLADRIVYFLYGEAYLASVIALQVISLYIFIKFLNFHLGTVLSSIDRQGKRMFSQGIAALFNVLLNLLLIPELGYVGAAWSTFATEILLFATYYLYVSRSLYFYNFGSLLAKPAIAAAAMALFINVLDFGLLVTILLSAAVYFAALFILNALDKGDYIIIKSIFKNEKVQAD